MANNFVSYDNLDAILKDFNSKGVKVKVITGEEGEPAVAKYGAYFNSSTNKIYCRVGTQWKEMLVGGLGDVKTGLVMEEYIPGSSETVNMLHLGYYDTQDPTVWHDSANFTPFEIPAGGGGGASVVTISEVEIQSRAIFGAESWIEFYWDSTKQGRETGNAKSFVWKVNNKVVLTETNVPQKPASGLVKYAINIGQYLSTGNNNIELTITDIYNTSIAPSWTISCAAYSVRYTNLNEINVCGTTEKLVQCEIVSGTGTRYLCWRLDNGETHQITLSSSSQVFTVPVSTHGTHTLYAWIRVPLDQAETQFYNTDPITSQLIWFEMGDTTPIIAVVRDSFTVKQYTKANVKFVVLRPNGEGSIYESSLIRRIAYHNNVEIFNEQQTVDASMQEWRYSATEKTTELAYNDKLHIQIQHEGITIEKVVTVIVTDSGIELNIIRTNLIMDVDPSDKAPGVVDPTFGYKKWNSAGTSYDMNAFEYSSNFDWVNGGFQNDEENDCTTFVVKKGTYIDFDRSLFLGTDDTWNNGKTIQIIFKTENMENYDAVWAHCQSPNTETYQPSLIFRGHYAGFGWKKDQNAIKTYYDENSLSSGAVINEINLTFSSYGSRKIVRFWDSGVPANGMLSDQGYIQSDTTEKFRIGSDECDVILYRFKMYSFALNDVNVLDQFIADAITLEKKASRYNSNNILDDASRTALDQTKLLNNCPGLHVINIEAEKFPKNKGGDGKTSCIITHRVNRGTMELPLYPTDEQWTTMKGAKDPLYTLQGTSSLEYVESAPNLDLDMNKCKMIRIADQQELTNGYAFNENHIPVKYFNLKANVASSECANNRCLVYRSNDYDQCETLAKSLNPKVRNTLYGEPCVVFLKNTGNQPLVLARNAAEPGAARTVPAGETIFYFAGDMLNSKKNTDVVGQIYWDGVNHSGGMEYDQQTGKWHDATTMEDFQTCIEFGENNKTMCLFKNLPNDLDREAFEIEPNEEFIEKINGIGSLIPGWNTLSWGAQKEEEFDADASNFCSRYHEDNWGWGFTIKNADYPSGKTKEDNKILLYKAINDEIEGYAFTEEEKDKFKQLIKCQNYFEKGFDKFKELYTFVSSCSPFPKDTDTASEYYYPSGYTMQLLASPYTTTATETVGMRKYGSTVENTHRLDKRPVGDAPIQNITYKDTMGVIHTVNNYTYANRIVTVDPSEIPESYDFTYMTIQYTAGYDRDTKDYRRAKFSAGFTDYVHKDNMIFHYLYTEFFQLVDNRAKNTFWSYEPLSNTTWKWNVSKNYDNDTCLGTTNKGDLELRYGLEDVPLDCPSTTETVQYVTPTYPNLFEFSTNEKIIKVYSLTRRDTGEVIPESDYDYFNKKVVLLDTLVGSNIELEINYEYQIPVEEEAGIPQNPTIFNASQSAFWCNIRDTQSTSLRQLYSTLENSGCFDAVNVENQFYNYQKVRPEMLMTFDSHAKYLSPMVTGTTTKTDYFTSREFGEKIGQRAQFLHYQEIYFASKYVSSKSSGSNIKLHVYPAPEGQTYNSNVLLKPYSDMYAVLSIDGSSNTKPVRISNTEEKYVQFVDGQGNPFIARNEVNAMFYSGYNYTKIDNIQNMFAKTLEVVGNSKLGELKLGSTDPTFYNNFFDAESFSAFKLAKSINIRGCTEFKKTIDFEADKLNILRQFDGLRTKLSSIKFASGSPLIDAKIPETISNISVTKLKQLTPNRFTINGYNSLSRLYVDNCLDNSSQETFPTSETFRLANNRLKYIGLYGSNMIFDDARYFIKAIYPEAFTEVERWQGIPRGEEGSYTNKARITGNIYIDKIGTAELDILLGEEVGGVRQGGYFDPTETTITYDPAKLVQGKTLFKVEYLTYNGVTVDRYQYTLVNTAIGQNPYGPGGWSIPTKPDSADGQYYYTYNGKFNNLATGLEWNFATDIVTEDIKLVPQFTQTRRKFVYSFTSDEAGTTPLFQTEAIEWHNIAKFSMREVEEAGYLLPTKPGYLCVGFITYEESRRGITSTPRIRFETNKNTYTEDPMYNNPDFPYSTTCVPIFEQIQVPSTQKTFSEMTWAEIVGVCNAGQISSTNPTSWVTISGTTEMVWFNLINHDYIPTSLTEVKQIVCDNGDTYYIQPAAYLVDRYSDDLAQSWELFDRIPVTFETVDLANAKMNYNNALSTTTHGWVGSNIRAFLNGSTAESENNIFVTRTYNSSEGQSGTQSFYWKSATGEQDAYKYNLPIDLYQALQVCCKQNVSPTEVSQWDDITVDKLFAPSGNELGLDTLSTSIRVERYIPSETSPYLKEKFRQRPGPDVDGSTTDTGLYPIYGTALNTSNSTRNKKNYATSQNANYWSRHSSAQNSALQVQAAGGMVAARSYEGVVYYYYIEYGTTTALSFPICFCIGTPRADTP